MQNNIEKKNFSLALTHYYFVCLNVLILDDEKRAFGSTIQMLMWLIRFRRKNQTIFIMLLANVRAHTLLLSRNYACYGDTPDYAPFSIVFCNLFTRIDREDADDDEKKRGCGRGVSQLQA